MKLRYINVTCKYSNECKRYSLRCSSDCKTCSNNEYKDENDLKKDYYSPNTGMIVFQLCLATVVGGILIYFFNLI